MLKKKHTNNTHQNTEGLIILINKRKGKM